MIAPIPNKTMEMYFIVYLHKILSKYTTKMCLCCLYGVDLVKIYNVVTIYNKNW